MTGQDRLRPVPRLVDRPLRSGERWIYVAGCNIEPTSQDLGRIECEVHDLRRLVDAGARVAFLTHQGSHHDGSARPVPHVATHLSRLLGQEVGHHPASSGPSARARVEQLRPGDVVVLGNVRLDAREQQNDPHLAEEYAELGDAVAVGGFSRAHRRDASNHALLRRLPGWVCSSLLDEVDRLRPWVGGGPDAAVVLGGVKREKTAIALGAFRRSHGLLLPTGAVLNAVLDAVGHTIGDSTLGEDPAAARAAARAAVGRPGARMVLPQEVIVREPGSGRVERRAVADGVPAGWEIVDHVVPAEALTALRELAARGGRVLLAGTPSLVDGGHDRASHTYAAALEQFAGRAILLGGDTVQDVPFDGARSTGGGSALHLLVEGTLPVLSALAGRGAAVSA